MKNLQKFAVALLVGIMAIGFSAFKASDKKVSGQFAEKTYYRVGANYVFPEPAGSCETLDNISCSITFSGDQLPSVESFPVGSTPTGAWTAEPSSNKGGYED
ncbi:hypothetical protein [Pedobacter alluvionis]|uniref:Uncharacterized protein n=1 Tax=Pedobacter alluvionis TaxID=475253 RepID=A0A497Y8T3_9SPHI|nr:hypothetical protein [Pedobacter alluvionis]RLJ77368.1 hypothetical protein BCL90_2453 [Pedobacter alluvionis]TFB33413.1 hypothetical protein E3V97_05035 [Pedobacter alluvionis]